MKKVFAFFVFLALVTVACSFSVGKGEQKSAGEQGSTKPTGQVLFKDDFSDKTSGWDQVREDDGISDYENGAYRIFVKDAQTDIWANPGKNFDGDVVVEVDAAKKAGPDDNDFGVLCRYKDKSNYYFFIIGSDGYAAIGKVDHDSQILLNKGGKMVQVTIPNAKANKYHIKAACVGSHLTLWVNGAKLLSAEDTTFTSGDVGLIAGTFDDGGTDILFDNFVVSRP